MNNLPAACSGDSADYNQCSAQLAIPGCSKLLNNVQQDYCRIGVANALALSVQGIDKANVGYTCDQIYKKENLTGDAAVGFSSGCSFYFENRQRFPDILPNPYGPQPSPLGPSIPPLGPSMPY